MLIALFQPLLAGPKEANEAFVKGQAAYSEVLRRGGTFVS